MSAAGKPEQEDRRQFLWRTAELENKQTESQTIVGMFELSKRVYESLTKPRAQALGSLEESFEALQPGGSHRHKRL